MARIMVAEDDEVLRKNVARYFKYKGFEVVEASNGVEVLKYLNNNSVDIILMDVDMPLLNGFRTADLIRRSKIPTVILMITALRDEGTIAKMVDVGVDDFILKPVNFSSLEIRIKMILDSLEFHKTKNLRNVELKEDHERLFETLASLEREMEGLKGRHGEALTILRNLKEENTRLAFELLEKLYMVSEFKDFETHEHALRVGTISALLTKAMGKDERDVISMQLAAPLHDIGKVGVPEQILLKPERLSDEEFEVVKRHCEIGFRILSNSSSPILNMAARIALTHHERWDGKGYPRGFRGTEIPWEGRVVAVVDSLDAMTNDRPYRKARTLDEALDEICEGAGTLYDPEVVEALGNVREEVRTLYESGDETISTLKSRAWNLFLVLQKEMRRGE